MPSAALEGVGRFADRDRRDDPRARPGGTRRRRRGTRPACHRELRGRRGGDPERAAGTARIAPVLERQRVGVGIGVRERDGMSWQVPGTTCELLEERNETGRLLRLTIAGRVYLSTDRDGTRRFDGGVTMSELAIGATLFRKVSAGARSWTEVYRMDEAGRPIEVDGVEVRRDDRGRVTACGEWRYTYAGDHLAAIETPSGLRHLTHDGRGRPVRRRDGHGATALAYDADGGRLDVAPPPDAWNRDELGRLWTVTGADGAIVATYLWDGFACFGRVDGPPGAPLAAVFSLDPTCTPVRIIEGDDVTRVPRDAFGEALLDHPGVPGLFGGAQHDGRVYFAARPLDPATRRLDRARSLEWPGGRPATGGRLPRHAPRRAGAVHRLPGRPGRPGRSHRRGVDRADPEHRHLVVAEQPRRLAVDGFPAQLLDQPVRSDRRFVDVGSLLRASAG